MEEPPCTLRACCHLGYRRCLKAWLQGVLQNVLARTDASSPSTDGSQPRARGCCCQAAGCPGPGGLAWPPHSFLCSKVAAEPSAVPCLLLNDTTDLNTAVAREMRGRVGQKPYMIVCTDFTVVAAARLPRMEMLRVMALITGWAGGGAVGFGQGAGMGTRGAP